MKNYRLKFEKLNSEGIQEIIFTTIIQAKSMRGAKMRAKNLQPFTWYAMSIASLECQNNLQLDRIEFNY
jgi:hypothetical protein